MDLESGSTPSPKDLSIEELFARQMNISLDEAKQRIGDAVMEAALYDEAFVYESRKTPHFPPVYPQPQINQSQSV